MKSRRCPTCNSKRYKKSFKKKGFHYVVCMDCEMMFINPIPEEDYLDKVYDDYGKSYFTNPDKLKADFNPARYKREIKLLQRIPTKKRLLDVGCSTGSFLVAAKKAGFREVSGIDIAQPSVAYAQSKGLDAQNGNFTQSLFPPDNFGVITMWATLEHLPNPSIFIKEAYRVLEPGGFLALSVPNTNSLSHLILGKKNRYIGSDHLNYFNRKNIETLLHSNGFEIDRIETRSINPLKIIADLLSAQVTVESQIKSGTRTTAIKNKWYYFPLRWIHQILDKILFWIGRGDLLLVAAIKSTTDQSQ